jgi:hypothetical protein
MKLIDVMAAVKRTARRRLRSSGVLAGSLLTCAALGLAVPGSAAAGSWWYWHPPLIVSFDGTGSGFVSSSPSGIDCGATCGAHFHRGTDVTLTATAAADSTFTGWSGACTGTGTCEVVMDQATNVTATFTQAPVVVKVTLAGTGSGTVTSTPAGIDCGTTCTAGLPYGTMASLTETPAPGSTFAGWSGDCSGTGTCAGTLNGNAAVTATFNTAPLSTPVVDVNTNIAPTTGTVDVELPGQHHFQHLPGPEQIPLGSTVDAMHGTAALTIGLPNGSTQTGHFYDGVFKVTQQKSGRAIEALVGGNYAGCPAPHDSDGDSDHDLGLEPAHTAAKKKKKKTVVRELWGNAHGDFTTKGTYGSAAVRGTIWLTQDRCDGTYFTAVKDSITVVSYRHPKHPHIVLQGHSFLVLRPGF